MKKTPLLLTLGFILLLAGSFFIYQYFFKKTPLSAWNIIPEQTVLIYEVGDCSNCFDKVNGTTISELYSSLIFNFSDEDSLKRAFSFLTNPQKGQVISLHVTSKDNFDFIYYYPKHHVSQFESIVNSWRNVKGSRFSERILNGVSIQELRVDKRLFSWTVLDEVWVGSFTPFLIEDVIRTYTSNEKSTFTNQIAEVYALPRIKNDPGNIYIHLGNFINWLTVFTVDTATPLSTLGQASLLDIKQEQNSITLNGFSLTRKTVVGSILSYFENQSPVQFSLKQYISNRTLFATTYGISDGSAFYQNLNLSKNKRVQDSLLSLTAIDFVELFSSFGDEMALCYQESKTSSFSKVILFETEKPSEWLNVFDRLSKAAEKEDTVFFENYSGYEIREIEINNLPGKLFSPLTSGFSQTYYTSLGNTVVLSEQLEEIKQFLDDIDREDVWGKSVVFNKFLEATLLESNVSVYMNTPSIWSSLSTRLNPRWKEFVSKNQTLLNSINLGAIQFSHLNESFYTNATLTFTESSNAKQSSKGQERLVVSLASSIIGKPFVLKSHVNRADEVLVQDSLFNLHHFSSDGKLLWKMPLEGGIIGEVRQVDYFKNGKLQFFFVAGDKLHVIDRLGNYVRPFPVETKIKELDFVSLVDYDNSKKYRFMLTDKSGKMWMYDKEAQILEGWRPRNVEGSLFSSPEHYRIRGKDYILAIRKDGWAYLMNRRGENLKGFPLNLDARPDGDYYVEVGNSVATTYFVCVSRDGFRIKFNLEGKILSRETLVKPSFETQFSLISEHRGKSYLIRRQDAKRLTLLDESGREILFNDFIGINPVAIQYYDFGAGKVYISITDLEQDLSYIYDEKGSLLNSPPVEGNAIELRVGGQEFPREFIVNGNTVIIQ